MPTRAFNYLIVQLDDSELANFYYEIGRQNSIDYIEKTLLDEGLNTTHTILLCLIDFGSSTQGPVYWNLIFSRLIP
jgi:hypothetical protein